MDIATITALCQLIFNGLAILIVFLVYLKSHKSRQKEYEEDRAEHKKRNEELHENYNAMIQDIIQGVTTKHLTPRENNYIGQIEKQINDGIENILHESNASRVCIIRYHNGNKDMMGKSFLKMSMTNEVVSEGISLMMRDFKDIFRSLLSNFCCKLDEEEKVFISDVEKLKTYDTTMYEFLKTRDIEAGYVIAVKDSDSNTVAFMTIEYMNKNKYNKEKIEASIAKHFPKVQALLLLDGSDV